jgi:hypothetical protein
MAVEIRLMRSGQPIVHGSCVVSCTPVGEYSTLKTNVVNTPTIAEIQEKYDDRFDNPGYYYGGGADGGSIQ